MNGKLVYLLEDDPDISELIEYILSDAGYEVVPCGTVSRFNEVVGLGLPDLFILDIMLPDGNGLDSCRQLRKNKNSAGIPILIMSAHQTKQDIEAAGCGDDFIAKPFNIDYFLHRVNEFAS